MNKSNFSCWIVTEGMAGTENQCLGITDQLGITPEIKRIKLRFPWKQLSPYFRVGQKWACSQNSDSLTAPWPDLVIASGRKSIPAALHIKKASKNKTLVVQVQDPRISSKHFDLVVVPQHDPTRGDNVMTTTGALHRVTAEKRKTESAKFPNLYHEGLPHIAVLLGGNSRAHTVTKDGMRKLAAALAELAHGHRILMTASRRTPDDCLDILKDGLTDHENVYLWDGTGDNPYFAFLEFADYIMVTEDSVSMTSEAISTGKPVYTIPLEGGAPRLNKFHELLQTQGYTRIFSEDSELEQWQYKPPHDTLTIANKIKSILEERTQKQ